jgi:cell division protein FtsQ
MSMFRRIGKILIWCLVALVVSGSLGFTIRERKKIVCTDVRVEITDSTDNQFLRSRQIREWVLSHNRHILRQNLDRIDLRQIEDGLRKIKAVEDVKVFTSIVGSGKPGEGSLVVRISQRDPEFRVDLPGRDYYMDRFGKSIDWTPGYTPRVLIVSGVIAYEFARKKLLPLITYIQEDPFLSAQIDQIHVGSKGNLTMVPRIGDQLINFGSPDDYQDKFRNLKALYKEGFKNGGWTVYKSINLAYKNQVICLKKR